MYSSRQKKAQTTNPLPCPDCAAEQMVQVVETVVLSDGTKVSKLNHLKCSACGSRFYDDQAMQTIRQARSHHSKTTQTA